MEGKTLFEIPIYSMSQKKFENRWKKKRDNLYKQFIEQGHTEESAHIGVSNCFYPRWLWQYNQVVGYIRVSVTKVDVLFDLYCSLDERYAIDSKSRHYIQNWSLNGTHFRIGEKNNEEIRENIKSWLKVIENNHIPKRFYVDYSTFDNILDFLNIRGIVDTL